MHSSQQLVTIDISQLTESNDDVKKFVTRVMTVQPDPPQQAQHFASHVVSSLVEMLRSIATVDSSASEPHSKKRKFEEISFEDGPVATADVEYGRIPFQPPHAELALQPISRSPKPPSLGYSQLSQHIILLIFEFIEMFFDGNDTKRLFCRFRWQNVPHGERPLYFLQYRTLHMSADLLPIMKDQHRGSFALLMQQVRHLKLHYCEVLDVWKRVLSMFKEQHTPQLKKFHIDGGWNRVSELLVDEMPAFVKQRLLEMSCFDAMNEEDIQRAVATVPDIQEFEAQFSYSSAPHLAGFTNLKNLVMWDSDRRLLNSVLLYRPDLVSLEINTDVDESIEFPQLIAHPNIHRISLQKLGLPSSTVPHLRSLRFLDCRVKEGFDFAGIEQLPLLEVLSVFQCEDYPHGDVRFLNADRLAMCPVLNTVSLKNINLLPSHKPLFDAIKALNERGQLYDIQVQCGFYMKDGQDMRQPLRLSCFGIGSERCELRTLMVINFVLTNEGSENQQIFALDIIKKCRHLLHVLIDKAPGSLVWSGESGDGHSQC